MAINIQHDTSKIGFEGFHVDPVLAIWSSWISQLFVRRGPVLENSFIKHGQRQASGLQ